MPGCVFPRSICLHHPLSFQHVDVGLSKRGTMILLLFANLRFFASFFSPNAPVGHMFYIFDLIHHPKPLSPLNFPARSKAFGFSSWVYLSFPRLNCRNRCSSPTFFPLLSLQVLSTQSQSTVHSYQRKIRLWRLEAIKNKALCLT